MTPHGMLRKSHPVHANVLHGITSTRKPQNRSQKHKSAIGRQIREVDRFEPHHSIASYIIANFGAKKRDKHTHLRQQSILLTHTTYYTTAIYCGTTTCMHPYTIYFIQQSTNQHQIYVKANPVPSCSWARYTRVSVISWFNHIHIQVLSPHIPYAYTYFTKTIHNTNTKVSEYYMCGLKLNMKSSRNRIQTWHLHVHGVCGVELAQHPIPHTVEGWLLPIYQTSHLYKIEPSTA